MPVEWITARNHYLAMAALALALMSGVALFDPAIASAVALPTVFFTAVTAGAKFAALTGRAMQRNEALRLAAIASALQLAVGVLGILLAMLVERQQITTIHFDIILLILAVTVVISLVVTLAGLRFGAFTEKRRLARGKRPD
jgi:hypothetical protein